MTQPIPHPADATDAEIERQLRGSRQLEDAPEHVIQRAMAVWQPRRQAVAEPSALRRLLALLTFDSAGASPLAFGMRSAGGTVRQMLFSAEGHDIDLRIQAAGDAAPALWGFSGQVLGPQAQGLVSITDAQGQAAGASALDDLGEFRLPAVASGQYTLTLSLGEHEIVLPSIDVPQGA